jgi:hypothetical protein
MPALGVGWMPTIAKRKYEVAMARAAEEDKAMQEKVKRLLAEKD